MTPLLSAIALSAIAKSGIAGIAAWIAFALTAFAAFYVTLAAFRVWMFPAWRKPAGDFLPPVTVMKPVCGLDLGLYENLTSFCRQDYPLFQVIFGVRDAADPAIPVIRRIIEENPKSDLALVVDAQVAGPNLKISNLVNMDRETKHGIVVIADSDMRVGPDYLKSVAASFADPRVGGVTCLYKGTPAPNLASKLCALFINDHFLPSVLVALLFQKLAFCMGATMAVRRDLLREMGGFVALSQYLADDYMLGNLIAKRGFLVKLSTYVLENIVQENDFASLIRHELRWARTIRNVQPVGYAFSFVMYALPLSILAAIACWLVSGSAVLAAFPVLIALVPRLALHYVVLHKLRLTARPEPWLVPIRDCFGFLIWGTSFFGRDINWRGRDFAVHVDGSMTSR